MLLEEERIVCMRRWAVCAVRQSVVVLLTAVQSFVRVRRSEQVGGWTVKELLASGKLAVLRYTSNSSMYGAARVDRL